ncbi:hypothetical protein K3495_g5113 [Podosphaera aphanis]|nr:hypothetical protein K3495_g5113 [Podosphaera aphanis]
MSTHMNLPGGCKNFNNGLTCKYKKCKYIHCNAEREEAIQKLKRKQVIEAARSPNDQVVKQNLPSGNIKQDSLTHRTKLSSQPRQKKHCTPPQCNKQNSLSQYSKQGPTFHQHEIKVSDSSKTSVGNIPSLRLIVEQKVGMGVPKRSQQISASDASSTPTRFQRELRLDLEKPYDLFPDPGVKIPPETPPKFKNSMFDKIKSSKTNPARVYPDLAMTGTASSNANHSIRSIENHRISKAAPNHRESLVQKKPMTTPTITTPRLDRNKTKDSSNATSKPSHSLDSFMYVRKSFATIFIRPESVSASAVSPLGTTRQVAEKDKGSEECTTICRDSPADSSIEEKQANSNRNCLSQEVLDSWDPLRMQWVDNLKPRNRKAYLRDVTVNVDGKNIQTVAYNTEALLAALTKPEGDKEKKFKHFPNLPPEIRNQIWKYAKLDCSSTCYVQLDVKQGTRSPLLMRDTFMGSFHDAIDAKFTYHYDVPGLFGACRESRSIMTDMYGKPRIIAFDKYTGKPFPSGHGSCRFNFEKDRLFLITRGLTTQLPECVEFMKYEERSQIRHLAIPLKDYFHEAWKVVEALLRFSNLQTLDLIVGDGKDDLDQIGDFDYSRALERSFRKHFSNCLPLAHHRKEQILKPPKVKIEFVNEVQARIWGIDCLKWDKTSRPIR